MTDQSTETAVKIDTLFDALPKLQAFRSPVNTKILKLKEEGFDPEDVYNQALSYSIELVENSIKNLESAKERLEYIRDGRPDYMLPKGIY